MAKECNKENCTNPVFGKGYCKWHQYLRTNLKPKKRKIYTINNISPKMLEKNKEYRLIRDQYMMDNPICEFNGCVRMANDLHHKSGRGKNLSNDKTFMAVCRTHHTWIHEHPIESREFGYLK